MKVKALTNRSIQTMSFGFLVSAGFLVGDAEAISFNLMDVTPGGMSAAALAGFQQAVDVWEALIDDPITINLDIRFDNSLGATILGQASSTASVFSYADVRAALVGDSFSMDDATAVASLPTGTALSFLTNDPNTSAVVTDNDASGNNRFLAVNYANARALGLAPASDLTSDASIAFNSNFSWDFDQTDGVGAGLQDFVGVTVHEIGHALGFTSGVDTVDSSHGMGSSAPMDLNGFAIHSVLDLFRYSAAGQLNFATGGSPYFAIDGGTTSLGTFSTGVANGDGRQASHWEDGLGLGIMDPTANSPGTINTLSGLDLLAIDVIGYQLILPIPEPSAALLLLVSAGLVARRRR